MATRRSYDAPTGKYSDYDFRTPDKPKRYFLPARRPPTLAERLKRDLELQQAHERNATVGTKIMPPRRAEGAYVQSRVNPKTTKCRSSGKFK